MIDQRKAQDFLRVLGISNNLTPADNSDDLLVMDIADSNKFGAIYSKLDKAVRNGKLDEDSDSSNISYDSSSMQYANDDYIITLIGDLDADTYRLTIKETNDEN